MKLSLHHRFDRHLGFSLLELIVSISVVAILIGLTFPVWQRTVDEARSSKCLVNLKRNADAALLFISENNGNFFSQQSWFRQDKMRQLLGPPDGANYLRDTILTCHVVKAGSPYLFPRDMNQCYAKNFFLNIKHTSSTYASDEANRPLSGGPGNIRNVPRLSAMWMFTDSWHIGPDGGGQISPEWRRQEIESLKFPHRGRQNTVFMDGHTEALAKSQWINPPSLREFWGEMALPQ